MDFIKVDHMDYVFFLRWLSIYGTGYDVIPVADTVQIFASNTLIAKRHLSMFGEPETFFIQTEPYSQMKQVESTLK